MSFPIFPDKYKLEPLITADQMVEFRRKQGGLKGLKAPSSVVLCSYNGVIRHFGWKYPSRHLTSFQSDLFLLNRKNGAVGVAGNFGMGAPAVVALSEQLIAWGARRLVFLSLAGGLQPGLEPGDVVLGARALRDEGTSYHYLPPAEQVHASPQLVAMLSQAMQQRGLPHTTGLAWSTDAAYRETREEIHYFQGQGAQAVDMESAGLFALGQVRRVETASLYVVGHNLVDSRWLAPTGMRAIHQRFKQLLNLLIDVFSEL